MDGNRFFTKFSLVFAGFKFHHLMRTWLSEVRYLNWDPQSLNFVNINVPGNQNSNFHWVFYVICWHLIERAIILLYRSNSNTYIFPFVYKSCGWNCRQAPVHKWQPIGIHLWTEKGRSHSRERREKKMNGSPSDECPFCEVDEWTSRKKKEKKWAAGGTREKG